MCFAARFARFRACLTAVAGACRSMERARSTASDAWRDTASVALRPMAMGSCRSMLIPGGLPSRGGRKPFRPEDTARPVLPDSRDDVGRVAVVALVPGL